MSLYMMCPNLFPLKTDLFVCLCLQVFQELCEVLHNATYDDSRLVMFTGSRGVFCSGIDLNFLTCGDRHVAAKAMSDGLRYVHFHLLLVLLLSSLSLKSGVRLAPLPVIDLFFLLRH